MLVDVLTQIAKDVAKTHPGKRNYVSWLDWMGRVIGWEKKFLTQVWSLARAFPSFSSSIEFPSSIV
jgi:hypothetical protein